AAVRVGEGRATVRGAPSRAVRRTRRRPPVAVTLLLSCRARADPVLQGPRRSCPAGPAPPRASDRPPRAWDRTPPGLPAARRGDAPCTGRRRTNLTHHAR